MRKEWEGIKLLKVLVWGNLRVIMESPNEEAECARMVGVGTSPKEMAYFRVGGQYPLWLTEVEK